MGTFAALWLTFVLASDPLAKGPYHVGIDTVDLRDGRRGERLVKTEIWYPTETAFSGDPVRYPVTTVPSRATRRAAPVAGKFPLLIFSHGMSGSREQSTYLCEHLASHGFILASPDHLGNTRRDMNALANYQSAFDRPQDVRFVIDQTLTMNRDSKNPLAGKIDERLIGVMGHSFGGYTTLAVGGAQIDREKIPKTLRKENQPRYLSFADPRVKAIVAFAPLCSLAYDEEGLHHLTLPALIFAATRDPLTPFDTNQAPIFEHARGPRWLAKIQGATHFTFANNEMIETAPFFVQQLHAPTISRDKTDKIILSLTLAFLDRYLRGTDRYSDQLVESDGDAMVRFRAAGPSAASTTAATDAKKTP